MNEFKYTSRPFVNRVNLETLGKSFDTLEQGHKEAVKTASDLSRTIASLNMNEKENDFKANLLNEIQTTIEDNTIYGNSYAALDDIIEKSGDILSNPAVTGRLKAQQAYEEYNRNIDNNRDLTERDKLYFKEHNPYHYEDEITEDGKVLEGKAWQPTISPTKHFDLQEALVRAINIAAKESGGGTQIRYIDANGKPTTDIKQAWNGEVFDEVTTSWNRLSKEKIKQALESVIRGTNGAIESLKQQHDIAVWDTQKQVEKTGQLVKDGEVTDENGELLDLKDWIAKSVGEGIDAASYYNSNSSRRMGSGYANWIKTMQEQQLYGSGKGLNKNDLERNGFEGIRSGLLEKNVKVALAFNNVQEAAAYRKQINDMWKAMGGKVTLFQDDASKVNLNNVLGIPDTSKLGKVDKAKWAILSDLIEKYNDTVEFYNRNTKNLSKKDSDYFKAGVNGYDVTKITNGTDFGRNIISSKNILKYRNAEFIVAKDKKTGKTKHIPINDFYKNTNILTPYMNNNFDILVTDKNYDVIGTRDKDRGFGKTYISDVVKSIYKNNNKLLQKSSEAITKMTTNTDDNKVTSELTTYALTNFSEVKLQELYDRGLITTEKYNSYKKKYEEQSKQAAIDRDYNSVEMYVKDDDNISREITETSKKNEYGNKIKSAFHNNSDYKITTSIGTSGSKVGHHYVITEKDKPDETIEIFVAFSEGEAEEFMANAYMIDPRSKATDDAVYIASRKKGEGKNYNDNMFIPKTLDAQSRANGDGTVNVTFCNRTRTVNVGDAATFKLLIDEYKDIKRSIQLKGYFDKNDSIEMANTVNKLANFFGVSNAEAFYEEMQAKDNDLIIYK